MKNGIRAIAVTAALLVAAMVPALTLPNAREREPGRPVTRAELVESVRQILSSWDESLLQVSDEAGRTEAFVREAVVLGAARPARRRRRAIRYRESVGGGARTVRG